MIFAEFDEKCCKEKKEKKRLAQFIHSSKNLRIPLPQPIPGDIFCGQIRLQQNEERENKFNTFLLFYSMASAIIFPMLVDMS